MSEKQNNEEKYVSWDIGRDLEDYALNGNLKAKYNGKDYQLDDNLRDFDRASRYWINDYAIGDLIISMENGVWDESTRGYTYLQKSGDTYSIELASGFFEVKLKRGGLSKSGLDEHFRQSFLYGNNKRVFKSSAGDTLKFNVDYGTWSITTAGGINYEGTYEYNKEAIIFHLGADEMTENCWDFACINIINETKENIAGKAAIHANQIYLQKHKICFEAHLTNNSKFVGAEISTEPDLVSGANYKVVNTYASGILDPTIHYNDNQYNSYIILTLKVSRRCTLKYTIKDKGGELSLIDSKTKKTISLTGSKAAAYVTKALAQRGTTYTDWLTNEKVNSAIFWKFGQENENGRAITKEVEVIEDTVTLVSRQVADGHLAKGWAHNRFGNRFYYKGHEDDYSVRYIGPSSFAKLGAQVQPFSGLIQTDGFIQSLPYQKVTYLAQLFPGTELWDAQADVLPSNVTLRSVKSSDMNYLSEYSREFTFDFTSGEKVSIKKPEDGKGITARSPQALLYRMDGSIGYDDDDLFVNNLKSETKSDVCKLTSRTANQSFGRTKFAAINGIKYSPKMGVLTHNNDTGLSVITPDAIANDLNGVAPSANTVPSVHHDVALCCNLDLEFKLSVTTTDISEWSKTHSSGDTWDLRAMKILIYSSYSDYSYADIYSNFDEYWYCSGDEVFIILKLKEDGIWKDYDTDKLISINHEYEPWHLRISESTQLPVGSSFKDIGEISPWEYKNSSFSFWDLGIDFLMPDRNFDLNIYLTDRYYSVQVKRDPFEGITCLAMSSEIQNYFYATSYIPMRLANYAFLNLHLTSVTNTTTKNKNGPTPRTLRPDEVFGNNYDDLQTLHYYADSVYSSYKEYAAQTVMSKAYSDSGLSGSGQNMLHVANSLSTRFFSIPLKHLAGVQLLSLVSSMYTYHTIVSTIYSVSGLTVKYPGQYRVIAAGGNTGRGGDGGKGGASVSAVSWRQGVVAVTWWLTNAAPDANLTKILNNSAVPVSRLPFDCVAKPGGHGGDGFVGGDGGTGGDACAGGVAFATEKVFLTIYLGIRINWSYSIWRTDITIDRTFGPGIISLFPIRGFAVYLVGGHGGDGGNGGDGWLLAGRGGGAAGGTNGLSGGNFGTTGGCDSEKSTRPYAQTFATNRNKDDLVYYFERFKSQKYRGCLFDALMINIPFIKLDDTKVDANTSELVWPNKLLSNTSTMPKKASQRELRGLNAKVFYAATYISADFEVSVYMGKNGIDGQNGSAVPTGYFGISGSGGCAGTPTLFSFVSSEESLKWITNYSFDMGSVLKSSPRMKELYGYAEGGLPGASYTYQLNLYDTNKHTIKSLGANLIGMVPIKTGSYEGPRLLSDWGPNNTDICAFHIRISDSEWLSNYDGNRQRCAIAARQVQHGVTMWNNSNYVNQMCLDRGRLGTYYTAGLRIAPNDAIALYGWEVGCGCVTLLESPLGVHTNEAEFSTISDGGTYNQVTDNNQQRNSIGLIVPNINQNNDTRRLISYLLAHKTGSEPSQLTYPFYSLGVNTIRALNGSNCAMYEENLKGKQVYKLALDHSSQSRFSSGTAAYYGASGLQTITNKAHKTNAGDMISLNSGALNVADHDQYWKRRIQSVTYARKNSLTFSNLLFDGSSWPWCGAGFKLIYMGFRQDDGMVCKVYEKYGDIAQSL